MRKIGVVRKREREFFFKYLNENLKELILIVPHRTKQNYKIKTVNRNLFSLIKKVVTKANFMQKVKIKQRQN